MRVLGARLVIKQDEVKEKTKSGLVLAKETLPPACKGTVIAVGNGALMDNGTRVPVEIKVGETVVFSQYVGNPITDGANTYIVLNERDVLAVLD